MEIRLRNENDDASEISNVYEESWKYAYKGIIPQSFLDSITNPFIYFEPLKKSL